MYKLTTTFAFFRFNSSVNQGNLTVTWFALDKESDGEEEARCFTKDELDVFTHYAINNPINFPGAKNYHSCDEADTPYSGIYSALPDEGFKFPTKFILRKRPTISSPISDCVDVILTDNRGVDNHVYNLTFNVIGKITL